jgi:hypothetical protein
MHTKWWLEALREGTTWKPKEAKVLVCEVLKWFRIGSNGGLMWLRWWTFGFHSEFLDKMNNNEHWGKILCQGVSEWLLSSKRLYVSFSASLLLDHCKHIRGVYKAVTSWRQFLIRKKPAVEMAVTSLHGDPVTRAQPGYDSSALCDTGNLQLQVCDMMYCCPQMQTATPKLGTFEMRICFWTEINMPTIFLWITAIKSFFVTVNATVRNCCNKLGFNFYSFSVGYIPAQIFFDLEYMCYT